MSTPWRIHLFGPLVVEKPTGERIPLAAKKAGELLAYVALQPDQAHPREKLISVVWDGADVGSARTRLRQEILKLRTEFATHTDPFPLLLITPDALQVQPGTQIDAVRFLTACTEAKQAADWETRQRLYAEIRELYSGDLLPQYDSLWIVAERARFSQRYEQALSDCAEMQRQRRDYAEAEETLRCLLKYHPTLEEGHVALMRLYAEQGQPTRVQQQYEALERVLRETAATTPTEGTRQLATILRADAGQCAAVVPLPPTNGHRNGKPEIEGESDAPEVLPEQEALPPPTGVQALRPVPVALPGASGRRFVRLFTVGLVVLACAPAVWFRRATHSLRSHAVVTAVPLARNQEKWTYLYQPRPGEKPNAEGTAIAGDASGIYVTGFIDTDKEDVDILTVKLSPDGKPLWADRYSSPKHDCDRAYSIYADGQGSVYVAGETYVPAHHKDPEGWYLTLIRYLADGTRKWVRRSPLPVQNEGHNMEVSGDNQGGCYVGGTALVGGKQAALLLRYDKSGRMLWQKMLCEGIGIIFSRLAVASDGRLYVCGTARRTGAQGDENDLWLVGCLHPDGSVAWTHFEDGPVHGRNMAGRLSLDHADNVYVAGICDMGDTAKGGQGIGLAIERLNRDGTRMWRHIVPGCGPNVVLETLALNFAGDVAIGGTERLPDGSQGIVMARYDALGNLIRTWRYARPPGYGTTNLKALALSETEETWFFGQITQGSPLDFQRTSSVLVGTYSFDGQLMRHSLFDVAPHQANRVNDFIYRGDARRLFVTGQAGLANSSRALLVLSYGVPGP